VKGTVLSAYSFIVAPRSCAGRVWRPQNKVLQNAARLWLAKWNGDYDANAATMFMDTIIRRLKNVQV
jgi:hypothetical protein